MEQKNISEKLGDLRRELRELILEGRFPEEASDALLRMVIAGELGLAFETLEDTMSEYEIGHFTDDFHERLSEIRRRLNQLPSKYR